MPAVKNDIKQGLKVVLPPEAKGKPTPSLVMSYEGLQNAVMTGQSFGEITEIELQLAQRLLPKTVRFLRRPEGRSLAVSATYLLACESAGVASSQHRAAYFSDGVLILSNV